MTGYIFQSLFSYFSHCGYGLEYGTRLLCWLVGLLFTSGWTT